MQATELILTNHQVDDHIMSNDDAMDLFRCQFPVRCDCVSKDGNKMQYTFVNEKQGEDYAEKAVEIIECLSLPLTVEIFKMLYGSYVGHVTVTIIYKK